MQFIDCAFQFSISSAVVTAIPNDARHPVPGNAGAEMREIFRQLDTLLAAAGVNRFPVYTARLDLQAVVRRAYGVQLQSGKRVEVAFTAELGNPA